MLSWTALALACGIFSLVALTGGILAPRGERKTTLSLIMAGLAAASIKITLFQQAPQWQDINPDSITYERNARAFAEHWQGRTVPGEAYALRGLAVWHAAGLHGPDWEANDSLAYRSIIGSHEWLYAAYGGLWYWLADAPQAVVIASNALWAAFYPAAAFGIALALGASRKPALAAGALALVDPSSGVNASWLLKDTLAGFLAMAALWGLAGHLRDGGRRRLLIAALALGLLGGVRYVAFLGLIIAPSLIVAERFLRRDHLAAGGLLAVPAAAWLAFWLLSTAPHSSPATPAWQNAASAVTSVVGAAVSTLGGGLATLGAQEGDAHADDTTLRWKKALSDDPALALVKSVAHTLFAPYPWVALHPGLTWHSFNELYYPGVVLWTICLPGIFVAVALGLRSREPAVWLVLLFLASQLAAYTIWQGEWSTRQRVFALPAFFALAALGWHRLIRRWHARPAASMQ